MLYQGKVSHRYLSWLISTFCSGAIFWGHERLSPVVKPHQTCRWCCRSRRYCWRWCFGGRGFCSLLVLTVTYLTIQVAKARLIGLFLDNGVCNIDLHGIEICKSVWTHLMSDGALECWIFVRLNSQDSIRMLLSYECKFSGSHFQSTLVIECNSNISIEGWRSITIGDLPYYHQKQHNLWHSKVFVEMKLDRYGDPSDIWVLSFTSAQQCVGLVMLILSGAIYC